ncbi:sugar nucleotide-binding protein [Shimia thalassica]|uniref:sugar nucleotide-binding protein n=1 Tax=Shimia thalassica TaxID=1715693 RepID=UPI002733EF15|nr:sugar nucleotide-binding protein [Shimia thalassica]MDP2494675.1 sugar nucleotide-binding protein [Shimia thalassica]
MSQSVLVLGASGRFGQHTAAAFSAAGWQVTPFDRKTDNLMDAAQGKDFIVSAWNPQYQDWASLVPDLHASVIAAARAADATVILPGNVYVFGAGHPGVWSETTPHLAANPLGQIRIEMEQAYRDSGVRTIVLRAGDYLDNTASGNWFDRIMASNVAKGKFTYPGEPNIAHAWAYLPDIAKAAVLLAEKRFDLAVYEDVHFPGFTLSGQDVADMISASMGQEIHLKRMSWLPLQLLAWAWPMARCLCEMRYLWNTPHSLSHERFEQLLPGFVHTPAEQAIARAVNAVLPASDHIAKSTQIKA